MSDTVNSLSDLQNLTEGNAAEAAATATAAAPTIVTSNAPLRQQELDKQGRAYATGRRKDAVARVWVKPGTGKITVNGRDQEIYFARPTLRLVINQPFTVTDRTGQYEGWRSFRSGRRSQARHRAGAHQV
jgi:small subunit ribosomal protein S9